MEVSDLRSFRGLHQVSLERGNDTYAGWTVFAGRNGAGKSTLLKALALSVVGPEAAHALVGVFDGWVQHDMEAAAVKTCLVIDLSHDRSIHRQREQMERLWVGLRWKVTQATDTLKRAKGSPRDIQAAKAGPWADAPNGWFIAGYGPYRHLGPPPAEVVRLSANPVLARLINLFNESATLSDAVDWLKALHARALEDRPGAADLRDSVLRVLNDGLLPDGSTVQKVDSEGLWIERDGVKVLLEQVSDGYRTVTALVVDILRRLYECYGRLDLQADGPICPLPGVVLIDEIDAHMHVAWQQRIGAWLTRHFPKIQFLVTTHSPFICQSASQRGLIRLPAPGEDRRIEHVSDEVFKIVTTGGADDAILTELFGLEHPHSAQAEAWREEIAALEVKVMLDTATEAEQARYDALKARLPNDLGELVDRRLRTLREA